MENYRHGDVTLHAITPEKAAQIMSAEGVAEERKKLSTEILALGEVTGHKHVLAVAEPKTLSVVTTKSGKTLIRVDSPASLTHEEHHQLSIIPGMYVKEIEREFDPFERSFRSAID